MAQAAAEMLVATPSSACHISLAHPPPVELKPARRDPWGREYPYLSVNSTENASDPGENFRVLPMPHPVLMLAYTSPSSLLLVGFLLGWPPRSCMLQTTMMLLFFACV